MYHVAAKWTEILTDEFARQASMEQDLGIPTALFAAPVREIVELGKSQIGFMNLFAIPLFQGVTDVMPGMGFCVEELQRNKAAWEMKIAAEQARARQDSDDSMKDGMFSPRSMSLAHPSDASHQKMSNASPLPDSGDLRRALLTKSPFLSPTNGVLSEEEPHQQPLPAFSTMPILEGEEFAQPFRSEPLSDLSVPTFPKPKQLQLSYATASAPGLVDHPSKEPSPRHNGAPYTNGVVVEHSLVTDTVVVDPPARHDPPKTTSSDKQRSSDGTEASGSAAGDWASQATSATTNKMPLSPSTKGTSILSDVDSGEKRSEVVTPTGIASSTGYSGAETNSRGSTKRSNCHSSDTSMEGKDREDSSHSRSGERTDSSSNGHGNGSTSKGVVVMEKVRNLKKKPSRFRMNFWKRSKSASPPIPTSGGRGVSQEDMRSN